MAIVYRVYHPDLGWYKGTHHTFIAEEARGKIYMKNGDANSAISRLRKDRFITDSPTIRHYDEQGRRIYPDFSKVTIVPYSLNHLFQNLTSE
jgi:hypothetical protein